MLNSITDYITSLKSDIPFYLFSFITSVGLLFFIKRMTTPLVILLMSIASVISVIGAKATPVMVIIQLFLFVLLVYVKFRTTDLDYRRDVFNVGMLFNFYKRRGNDFKSIGRIMPYNKFQLPYNKRLINLRDEYARGLIMITGSPGSGKTYGIMSMIRQDLDNGKRTVYFDYKGDEKIIKELREIARIRNIPVFEMSEYMTNFNYDPLVSLNKTGKIEAILNTRKWSMDGADAHYRTSTQLLIQKYIDKFDKIYDGKDPYTISFYNFIKKETYDRQSADAYSTLTKMIELLLTSRIKDVLYFNNDKEFSFGIEDQYLAIFSFVSSNKELANSISSFVFKDILDTGTVNEYDKELALYVEEYGSLENSMLIKDILEKGRSCGILTTMSMQDINQIVINTNQAYLNSVLGIVNTFIIYSGSTKITAEMIGGVQLYDIESVMVTLQKPNQRTGATPTAMYISRYSSVEKDKSIDVFKIKPYIVKDKIANDVKENPNAKNINATKKDDTKTFEKPEPEPEKIEKIQDEKDIEDIDKEDYMKFL